jgi:hypothetical protein
MGRNLSLKVKKIGLFFFLRQELKQFVFYWFSLFFPGILEKSLDANHDKSDFNKKTLMV